MSGWSKVVFGGWVAGLIACSDAPPSETIPNVPVFVKLNLNNPTYEPLTFPGHYVYLQNVGFRGIIVWHDWDGTYRAFDRACSYHPYEDCALIHVDSTTAFMKCGRYDSAGWHSCCTSHFDMTGWPIQGPAVMPLRQYTVINERSFLIIEN